jgi:predicted rRNA methylase YqxC with S4 and FtsJ domains
LIVHLVKPLFEGLKQSEAVDRRALSDVLTRVADAAERCDLSLQALMASPILGSGGTIEFLGLFRDRPAGASISELAEAALEQAGELADL